MSDLWVSLSASGQNTLLFLALLLPGGLVGLALLWGFRPWPLVRALLYRYRAINAIFVILLAVATGLGIGVTALERGIREGTARAADKFDLVVGTPGSELTLLFASVFLEPSVVGLIDGATFVEIAESDGVAFAAPLGFGDSYEGAPVVGTTQDLVDHLSEGVLEGRSFDDPFEAVIGHLAPLDIGDVFTPAHGVGDAAITGLHEDELTVVGRMPPTGSPWDSSIIVPIESVWITHGLANGHAPVPEGAPEPLGPPFDAAYFPGTPAVVIHPDGLAEAYGLRNAFQSDPGLMAIFPGTELANLYVIMGNIRAAMSTIVGISQGVVAIGVLTTLFVLTQLFARQLGLLAILGAPKRFVLAIVWIYAAVLLIVGTLLGIALGWGSAASLSAMATAQTDIAISARLRWVEAHMAAGFLSLSLVLALIPSAWRTFEEPADLSQ